jgi:hypothetical protein
MTPVYFDIETAPLPESELIAQMPEFSAPGNYKDPEKIKANIAEQQQRWLQDGALSALTGQVLCIGAMDGEAMGLWDAGPGEAAMLESWWKKVADQIRSGRLMVGYCCKTFDLPFLIRRSWKHGVNVPYCIFKGRYFADEIVDVAEQWGCGNRDPRDRISLDSISKFLGIGAKNGTGKDFAALWATDKQAASEYLKNDLKLTQAAYLRMASQLP